VVARLVTFLLSLNSSRWVLFDDTSDVFIEASMCLCSLFFISFFSIPSPHCNLWRERRKKKKEKKIRWHTKALIAIYHWYHKKDFEDINPTTPKKSSTMNRVGHSYCQRQANHLLTFVSKCSTLGSPLMIFFGIVIFISSIFFQWYWRCGNCSFVVSPDALFLLIFSPSHMRSVSYLFEISWFWITTSLNVMFFATCTNYDISPIPFQTTLFYQYF
jgi:hypothetical protein